MTRAVVSTAILVPSLEGGGAEFVAREWASYLTQTGHSVFFLQTEKGHGQKGSHAVLPAYGRGFWGTTLQVRRQLVAHKPQILLCLMPYWNLCGIIAARSIARTDRPQVIISERNVESQLSRISDTAKRVQYWLATALYRHADACIAISHPVAAELSVAMRVPRSKLFVVPNPSLGDRSFDGTWPTRKVRESSVSIVVPARLARQKRSEIAIAVARLLRDTGIDARVIYMGSGPLGPSLVDAGRRARVPVEVRGHVEDWFAHCPEDAVVLLPSLVEGFGNVLVEAASVGVPSVATSRALGVSDAVVPGVTAVLTLGESADEFADAVAQAMKMNIPPLHGWFERFTRRSSGAALARVIEFVRKK